MVITPIPHHTASKRRGEPSDLAMAAGVRKMPSAMDSPVTTAIVPANPICLRCSIEATSYADFDRVGIHRMVEMGTILSCSTALIKKGGETHPSYGPRQVNR